MATKKSEVWNFFTISATDDSKAVCEDCGEKVARRGESPKTFTTSNLRKNLKNRLPNLFTKLVEVEKYFSQKDGKSKTQTGHFSMFCHFK